MPWFPTSCADCGRRLNPHRLEGWLGKVEHDRMIAIYCPACTTPEQHAMDRTGAGTVWGRDAFGRIQLSTV